jgi:hypothetical protein
MKKQLFKILPFVIFLVAYTLIVFLLAKEYTAALIFSYIFALISAGVCLTASMFIGKAINSRYLTYHIFYIVASFTVLSVLTNTIFIVFSKNMGYEAPLIVNLIILAGYGVYFIVHFGAAKRIAENEIETKKQLAFVRAASEIVNNIMRNISDIAVQKKVESLYDAIRNSQAIGTSAVIDLEYEIINDVGALERYIENGDKADAESLINDIKRKLAQRNSEIRMEQNEVRQ